MTLLGYLKQTRGYLLLYIFYLVPLAVLIRVIFGERAGNRFLCTITQHDYADEHRYGHQPVCLDCGKLRS